MSVARRFAVAPLLLLVSVVVLMLAPAALAKTAKAAEAGQFELYKTTHHFDGTVANPQWLG